METGGMASDQKKAARVGAHIVFLDESGFLLIPPVHKTWAPQGQTPLLRHRYRHDRVSVISGVSVSPRRHRFSLYFQWHHKNIRQTEVCDFLRHILSHLRRQVIVIWDNATIHKGQHVRQMCHRYPRLHLEALPPYAPELNPDEGVWRHAKHNLANGRPDDLNELTAHVIDSLQQLACSQKNLRGCVLQTPLPLL
ncbi:IS630 family transposase [Chloroflexota bacterium]